MIESIGEIFGQNRLGERVPRRAAELSSGWAARCRCRGSASCVLRRGDRSSGGFSILVYQFKQTAIQRLNLLVEERQKRVVCRPGSKPQERTDFRAHDAHLLTALAVIGLYGTLVPCRVAMERIARNDEIRGVQLVLPEVRS